VAGTRRLKSRQCLLQRGAKRSVSKGLGQRDLDAQKPRGLQVKGRGNGAPTSGHGDQRYVVALEGQLHDELHAIHVGHQDVGHYQVRAYALKQRQGLGTIVRGSHLVAVLLQHLLQGFTEEFVVFNNQNMGHLGFLVNFS